MRTRKRVRENRAGRVGFQRVPIGYTPSEWACPQQAKRVAINFQEKAVAVDGTLGRHGGQSCGYGPRAKVNA